MRLICPNCGAQYEVADDVIPETGRDVQCSNCGHTWFEEPEGPGSAAAPAAPPAAGRTSFADAIVQSRSGGTARRPADANAPPPRDAGQPPEAEDALREEVREDPDEEDDAQPAWAASSLGTTRDAGPGPAALADPPAPPGGDPAGSGAIPGPGAGARGGGALIPPHVGRAEAPARPPAQPGAPRAAGFDAPGDTARVRGFGESDEAPPPAPAQPAGPTRRRVTPEIADILRTEAAREEAVRRAEAGVLESQPELGLDLSGGQVPRGRRDLPPAGDVPPARQGGRIPGRQDQSPLSRAAQDADRALEATYWAPDEPEQVPAGTGARAAEATAGPARAESSGARRELLPDIEEINSTLRPATERKGAAARPAPDDTADRQRSGFRLGFAAVVLLAAGLAAAYAAAPAIAERLPAAEPALADYVAAVDAARLWLDQQMQDLLARLNARG